MTLWLTRGAHGFKSDDRINLDRNPCPTILAAGNPGSFTYALEEDGVMHMPVSDAAHKPAYHVPAMAEIAALPWNGFTVASTFSGCGGSSLGYKLAGFKVVWASEFIPAAQEVYRLNHPGTILDTRDIRTVQPQEILDACGLQRGELDVLDGSPPCASFSTAGKRHKGWDQVKQYSDTKQRVDDLFFEYVRLVDGLQPKVFVAENVSGLVKGVAKGYFLDILRRLKACGYRVEARLLDAQWLGVPQMRQRIIFVGVREDLGKAPAFPKPLPYRYSVREALPWIVRQGDNGGFGGGGYQDAALQPSGCIGTGPQTENGHFSPSRVEARVHVEEANGLTSQGLGAHRMRDVTDTPMPTIQAQRPVRVAAPRAYLDTRGAFGHDGDMTNQPAPTVLADSVGTHWVEEPACGWDAADSRARSVAPNVPVPTILQHGRDWNQIAVQTATEKRKFTITELKRICAFPDDFQLTGTYAQQWERLGRAVPPVMMQHIAAAVRDGVLRQIPGGARG